MSNLIKRSYNVYAVSLSHSFCVIIMTQIFGFYVFTVYQYNSLQIWSQKFQFCHTFALLTRTQQHILAVRLNLLHYAAGF